MTCLIEMLLPVKSGADVVLARARDELTDAFGGVMMHVNAPADCLWNKDGEPDRDRIVVVEVMADKLDVEWWATYRRALEAQLEQEEIVIRASEIRRL